ncbi:MAG: AEC family transporter [Rhodoblastus sp.]
MNQVFAVTIPIFLLIAAGYFAVRRDLVEQAGLKALAAFVLHFALPALIVRALSGREIAEVADFRYFLVYGGASLLVFALVYAIARWGRGRGQSQSAIQALGATAANSGFFGYPTAALVLGAPAGVALSLNMAFENMILIPLALALAESGRTGGGGVAETMRATAGRLVRNPLIIAIAIGLALAATGLSLPAPVARAVDMLAGAAGAAALFAIGGALMGLETRGLAGDVTLVVFAKLIAHPLAVLVGLQFAPGLDPALAKAALIFAAAPVLTIYPLLGQVYGQGQLCAAALISGVALSFLTVSGLLYVL